MEKVKRIIKYIGIDYWSRPIFKITNVEDKYYLSDLCNLFSDGTPEETIREFYKDKNLTEHLTYHGREIDIDPHGGHLVKQIELVFEEKENTNG